MYYYENLYMHDNRNALETIEDLKIKTDTIKIKEKLLYKDVLIEYDKFIDIICKFLSSIDIKSPIELSIILSYLINNSYLSYGRHFDIKRPSNKIYIKPGINIVYGEGYDDEMSSIFKDVMDRMKIYNKRFYCYQSPIDNYDIGFDKKANHVNNLIEYNNTLYGFDLLNCSELYTFTSQNRLECLNKLYINKYLTYKPYIELINNESDIYDIKVMYDRIKEECKKDKIDSVYFENLKYDTYYWCDENQDMFSDFSIDNKDIKRNIYELILNK